eukprot:13299524-Ditylum_brightwellii.AAC.1
MQDKFNILSTKINSATYMHDVAGGHANWNKLRRAEKLKITHVITVTDKYCGVSLLANNPSCACPRHAPQQDTNR